MDLKEVFLPRRSNLVYALIFIGLSFVVEFVAQGKVSFNLRSIPTFAINFIAWYAIGSIFLFYYKQNKVKPFFRSLLGLPDNFKSMFLLLMAFVFFFAGGILMIIFSLLGGWFRYSGVIMPLMIMLTGIIMFPILSVFYAIKSLIKKEPHPWIAFFSLGFVAFFIIFYAVTGYIPAEKQFLN